jgi:NAD(P)-dependent dehydrogenase (short-subunit alcohol dehydrogenase family)
MNSAITGAASGIGLATARRRLEQGWTSFGLDAARDRLDAGAAQLAAFQDSFEPIVCDVPDATCVVAAVADVNFVTPALDVLICCAGILHTSPLESMWVEEFNQVFAVNTRGTWLCAKEAWPLLRKAALPGRPACIVLLSSGAALRRKISGGAYAAAKAAVSQLCRVMAVAWAPSGLLVNALAPGTVDTPMVQAMSDPAAVQGYRPSGVSPVGRIAQPDEVVDLICFLLSEAARYVTGTTTPVDGGTQAAFVPAASR